jgi:hypothetical protein
VTQAAPRILSPELEALLASRPPTVADAVRAVAGRLRPCVRLVTTRVSDTPLHGGLLGRLLQRAPPPPVLAPMASKFGGTPYCEHAAELDGGRFIGQVNFAEATAALHRIGFALPDGMPSSGILAADLLPGTFKARVRWYPHPAAERAATAVSVDRVAKYEARIDFAGGWSLRGLDWFDAVPKDDGELWDCMNDLEITGVDEDARGGHKLFGHANEVLNEYFDPAPGSHASVREHELVWRIDFDNAAGFAWGTNWLYFLIHRDDLARGALERSCFVCANA